MSIIIINNISSLGGDFINKFIKDIFNKGNFKDYFNRNKFFILASIVVLILSLWSGFTNYSSYTSILSDMGISQLTNNTPVLMFENNLIHDVLVIILGFTFSILSIFMTAINVVSIGYLFATQSFSQFLPQGIFVLISEIFALVGAFLVTKIEIRLLSVIINRKFNELFSKIKVPLKDLILTAVFIIILSAMGLLFGLLI